MSGLRSGAVVTVSLFLPAGGAVIPGGPVLHACRGRGRFRAAAGACRVFFEPRVSGKAPRSPAQAPSRVRNAVPHG